MRLEKDMVERRGTGRTLNWGPPLFFATLALVLVFFWWLLIYSGGVSGNHG